MAAGKNQHYVPQRYFRLFSDDGRSIRALKISDGSIIPSASIKGQASKAWFYGDANIETRLAELEGISGTSLADIASCTATHQLPEETLERFLVWIAVQRTRTESSRQTSTETDTAIIRMWLEAEINNNPNYSEEEKSALTESMPLVHAVDSTMQLQRMRIAAENIYELKDLKLVLLKNNSLKPFIFSDAPCVYYNLLRRNVNYKGVLGMKSLGLIIIFPINKKTMAIFYDPLSYNVRKGENGIRTTNIASDITSLNRLQFHTASNCVYYAKNSDDSYLQYLWKTEHSNLVGKNLVSREFNHQARSDGTSSSILMTYEPQIPIDLNLSFLSVKNIEFPSEINTREEYQEYFR
ncbi:DUF4238 domain-containing protein [Acidovorax sp. Be4]|uniref:DUF4238 domain-containing protein n=1 Tax=Acidovorax bellezanensis TaxID=2976702 RepID=A0ABT2PRD2_9BURK|nr:DUF4238 domain-containing protein [Acidovorax sp. Be4]MCT9812431.1 DUF4238 domain-containing protein [Acidovorax sp. Be4]